MTFELAQDDDVFVLTMDIDDNRFNPESLAVIHDALDTVEHHAGPAALVTTGTGKYYSNGLDLEKAMNPDFDWGIAEIAKETQQLLARTLLFPRPTVAAINGHCMAAGAMWSLAHDFRIMRADRGFWGLPEVDIRIPFTPGMAALIQSRLAKQTAHLAMTTAHRFGGAEAAQARIVDGAVDEDSVLAEAVAQARALSGKDSNTLGQIKKVMYGGVAAALLAG
ncbi:MAG: enoyl-CoA hydratase-related protein [Acidimicrobiia bacterium]|nr:enoyl-CoA hydratase-related protein [Acidimicrobiia bacterium]MDH5504683.1 enoyl-CoA hydratase-related protein [Acidimicrobiia bacterium]